MYHPPVRPPRALPAARAPRLAGVHENQPAASPLGRAARGVVEQLEARFLMAASVVFSDGFEGAALAAAWSARADAGSNAVTRWGVNKARAATGAQSAFASNTGPTDVWRNVYQNEQDNALVRDNVSLAGFKAASLSFKFLLNSESGYDFFTVNVVEPSGTRTAVYRDSGDDTALGWQARTIDLSAFAGRTGLDLEFRFESDRSVINEAASGVWVDDVKLTADTAAPPGAIRGTVFNDVDADRARDVGEAGLGGWVVYLDQNRNGRRDAGERSRTTAADGSYAFTGLAPGTYYVAEEVRADYVQTSPGASGATPTSGFRIEVNFPDSTLTAGQRAAFTTAANRWAQVITGDLPDVTDRGAVIDDIRIEATAPRIDGAGSVLGQAGPTAFRTGSLLPFRGFMEFDSADLVNLERGGQLTDVILHEMGHVLGIGTLWGDKGLLSGAGGGDPKFTGANAVNQYNSIFDRTGAWVPVENTGGGGTRDSHWRESVLRNELMTGFLNSGRNLLSRITVGSLADLGYAVNYGAADAFAPSVASVASTSSTASSSRSPASRAIHADTGVVPLDVHRDGGRTNQSLSDDAAGTGKNGPPPLCPCGCGMRVFAQVTAANTVEPMRAAAAAVTSAAALAYAHAVVVGPGENVTGIDFGNHRQANALPKVGWLSDGPDNIPAGAVMRLLAGDVTDADGAVAKVAFYRESNGRAGLQTGAGGDTHLGTDTTPGRSNSFDLYPPTGGLSPGRYTYYAQATDDRGAAGPARSTTHTIRAPVNQGGTPGAPTGGTTTGGAISGVVFHDLNGNGAREGDEPGLAGWRLFLDTDRDGQPDAGERVVTTDAAGSYRFTGLAAGAYSVREVIQAGYIRNAPSNGSHAVTLAAGGSATGKNFANSRAVTLAGRAFDDANANGRADAGEAGLPNVRVYIDRNDNGRLDAGERSTPTDAAGNYRFTWFGPGAYVIREVLPAGRRLTAPAGGAYRITASSGLNSTTNHFANARTTNSRLLAPPATSLAAHQRGFSVDPVSLRVKAEDDEDAIDRTPWRDLDRCG